MKMKNKSTITKNILLLLTVFLLENSCTTPIKAPIVKDLIERGRTDNLFYKLENRDTVKVAYLGGSITAQPGWRVYSMDWFKGNYPETEIVEIHAAIGGTGSPFGVYRVNDHVLQYKPDLVFVEFAVNDASTPPEKITPSMEGIVHQIWQQNPETDICFIYTIKEDFIPVYQKDSLPSSIITMEKIADHYQIPSINFGPEVLRRVTSRKVLFKGDEAAKDTIDVFSPDGVHPYPESGHKIYRDIFVKAFSQLKAKSENTIAAHKIKDPLSNPLVNARMMSWKAVSSGSELTPINIAGHSVFDGFAKYFDSIGEGQPGDSVSFTFQGKGFGFFDVIGPGTGSLSITIDGKEQNFSRFDKYCTYWRISYKTYENLENGVHQVTIKVLNNPIDKKAILAQRNNTMENEDDFETINWYLAKLMLDGELLQ